MKKLLSAMLGLVSVFAAHAQDPQLSQYYAAPLYLNPAFTGNLDYECRRLPESRLRFIGNYRNQYQGNYVTYMGSIDYRSKSGNWGYGALLYQDQQNASTAGTTPFSNFSGAALVSYKVGIINDWKLHSGVQLGYVNRSVNSGYIFPDQLSPSGNIGPTNEKISSQSVGNFDAAAGVLIYNANVYIGGAVHHLSQPNLSLTGAVDKLPMKMDVHTGYRIPFKKQRGFARRGADHSITPVVHYKRQGNAQQLDLGTYFNYEPIVLGAWYRGLPITKAPDNSFQQDALVLLAGLRAPTDYGLFKIGLSYDFPLSKGSINAGRTFELSLGYQFIDERCRKRVSYKAIPCPGL